MRNSDWGSAGGSSELGLPFEWLLYLFGFVCVVVGWWMVQNQDVVGWGLGVTGVALLVYVGWIAITKLDPHARDRIFAAVILMIGSVLFWALFEQAGSSLNLYTDRYVDRMLFGWEVPASMFQSINAIYIILLAPLFAWLWTTLGQIGRAHV